MYLTNSISVDGEYRKIFQHIGFRLPWYFKWRQNLQHPTPRMVHAEECCTTNFTIQMEMVRICRKASPQSRENVQHPTPRMVHAEECRTTSFTIQMEMGRTCRKASPHQRQNLQPQEWSTAKTAAQQAPRSKLKWAGHVARLHHSRERISNTQLQEWSMLTSAAQQASETKRKWAGHLARLHHTRWAQATTMWDPYRGKRSRGRPSTRWGDHFNKLVGPHWSRVAKDRNERKVLGNQLNAVNHSRGLAQRVSV